MKSEQRAQRWARRIRAAAILETTAAGLVLVAVSVAVMRVPA